MKRRIRHFARRNGDVIRLLALVAALASAVLGLCNFFSHRI